jgi:hypothetical protein
MALPTPVARVLDKARANADEQGMNDPSTAMLTYRNLRLSIIGVVVFLFAGAFWFVFTGHDLSSISGSYFTPVAPVFVGSLIAVGLALAALSGRTVRRMLLSLAAVFAPLIAIVPTTLESAACEVLTGEACPDDAARCVGPDVHGPIAAGMTAAVVVAAVLLAATIVAGIHTAKTRGLRAVGGRLFWVRVGLTVAISGGFFVWYLVDGGPSGSFEMHGHMVATGGFFGLIALVAAVHAGVVLLKGSGPQAASTKHPRIWGYGYLAIAVSLIAVVTVNAVLLFQDDRGAIVARYGVMWVFWLEVIALTLFAAFWIAQTVEFWKDDDASTLN